MTDLIDFSQCERLPSRAYNGANGKKIGYVDFFRRHANDHLAPSLARIAPRIDLAAICAFIDGVSFLSDLQRTFYKVYLTARHEALFGVQKVGAFKPQCRTIVGLVRVGLMYDHSDRLQGV